MTATHSESDKKRKKILIVDDEESFRLVLREVLDELGYQSVEAANAAEGLRAFQIERPLAVLLDIHLPDRSGFDVLREIRSISPHANVIVTTGESIEENELLAIRLGADDFIGKPIHPLELKYLLEKASSPARAYPQSERPRLLLVSDALDGMSQFRGSIKKEASEITVVYSLDELPAVLAAPHDLAILDLSTENIREVLDQIRSSPFHVDIPILVDKTRLNFTGEMAGIMPKYRAMPCTPMELIALTRRRVATHNEKMRPRPLL